MAILRRLTSRALTPQTLFRTGLDTADYTRNYAGVTVDVDSALKASPIWAAQKLISDDISSLPVGSFVKKNDGTRSPFKRYGWLDSPDDADPSITWGSHIQQVVLSILQYGESFIVAEPSVYDPVRLVVISPPRVEIRKPGLTPEYRVGYHFDGYGNTYYPDQMIHIAPFRKPGALHGLSPIEAAKEGIGLGIAAERYTSRFFGEGAIVPGFIEAPAGATQAQVDEMHKEFSKRHRGWRAAGVMGILTGGAGYKASGINPKDADLSAIREYQVEEACRIYGIPPHKLGSQKPGAVGYASIEQREIDYVGGLSHYIVPIETAYRRLTSGDSTYIKFNVAGLLRGDLKSRYEAYGVGLDKGFLSIDDVRKLEDMAPVPGGDIHRVLFQYVDINAPPATPLPPPTPTGGTA